MHTGLLWTGLLGSTDCSGIEEQLRKERRAALGMAGRYRRNTRSSSTGAPKTKRSSRKSRSCLGAPRTAELACRLSTTRKRQSGSGLKLRANSAGQFQNRRAGFCSPDSSRRSATPYERLRARAMVLVLRYTAVRIGTSSSSREIASAGMVTVAVCFCGPKRAASRRSFRYRET